MKRKKLITAGVTFGLATFLGFILLSSSGRGRAPDLSLVSTSGQKIRIDSLKGRPVLINFWASTCTSCMKEMPGLIKLYYELNSKGLEVFGVSMFYDPPIQVVATIKRQNIPYPVFMDLDRKIMHAFGMKQPLTPTTILIDTHGNIIYRKSGIPDMEKLRNRIITLLPVTSGGT